MGLLWQLDWWVFAGMGSGGVLEECCLHAIALVTRVSIGRVCLTINAVRLLRSSTIIKSVCGWC